MKKLTIGHLYPDLLNLYGDRGNIQCFRKRLEWRGMEAEVIPFLSGEKIDFSNVKVEPLFEEEVDFDTFSKSDFRAVKVKECEI